MSQKRKPDAREIFSNLQPIKKTRQKPGLTFSDFCNFEKQSQTSQPYASQSLSNLQSQSQQIYSEQTFSQNQMSQSGIHGPPVSLQRPLSQRVSQLNPSESSMSSSQRFSQRMSQSHFIPISQLQSTSQRQKIQFTSNGLTQSPSQLFSQQPNNHFKSQLKRQARTQDLIFSGPGPLQKQSQQPTKPVDEDKHIFMLETFARKENNQWCAYKNPKKVKLEISTKHNEVIFWLEPEPVCFYFEMGVRGKMITCGNKFLLTISNKKEIVYELEFTVIIEDGPRLIDVVSHFIKINRLKLSSRTQILASKAANNSRTELLKSLFDGYRRESMVAKDNSECKMSVYDLKKLEQWILKDETFPMYIEAVQNTLEDVLKTE